MKKKPKIKVLFSDVDGTLTDGNIYFTEEKEIFKAFHVHDGLGIVKWMKSGKTFGILSGNKNIIVRERMSKFGIASQDIGIGIENKLKWLDKWLRLYRLSWNDVAYIGDDENDLEVLSSCGFSVCPESAVDVVKGRVDYVCKKRGGEGAVREVIELILQG